MNIREEIQPIVLRYHETGWTEKTVACLLAAGFEESDIVYADRGGVGNMSKAFNVAFFASLKKVEHESPYEIHATPTKPFTWFLTNVTFPEQMPICLLELIKSDFQIAAVHPAFDSDHPHIKNAHGISREVPFIEWTAPLVRSDIFFQCLLDDKMPYWGMDLDWSYRIHEFAGYTVAVDGRHRLNHTYLRLNDQKEPVTLERERIRKTFDKATELRLIEKHGPDWLAKLWPTHPYVLSGRKTISE